MSGFWIFLSIMVLQVLLWLFTREVGVAVVDGALILTLLIPIYRKIGEPLLGDANQSVEERRRQLHRENAMRLQAEQAKEQTDGSDLPTEKDMTELAKEEEQE